MVVEGQTCSLSPPVAHQLLGRLCSSRTGARVLPLLLIRPAQRLRPGMGSDKGIMRSPSLVPCWATVAWYVAAAVHAANVPSVLQRER